MNQKKLNALSYLNALNNLNTLNYALLAAAALAFAPATRADVTVEQKTSLNLGSVVRMHGAATTRITAEKQREDSETHCEGVMSMFCGNMQSGEIIRLDRDLSWRLQPKKKLYREEVFATPEQMLQIRARMQAAMEKMRSCPVAKSEAPVDKSRCEMSAPKVAMRKTDDRQPIAGHDTQRTLATFTETCTDRENGSVCDTVVALDLWLTQDKLPGSDERRAFGLAYAKKLGLDDAQGAMRAEFARYLGPYLSQIKQLTDKSSDLKGQSLKSSVRVMIGGPQCKELTANDKSGGASDAGTGAGTGVDAGAGTGTGAGTGSVNPAAAAAQIAQTGKAIGASMGKLVGGMFGKKKADSTPAAGATAAADATPGAGQPGGGQPGAGQSAAGNPAAGGPAVAAAAPAAAPAAPMTDDPYAQFTQLATFSMETVSVTTDPIPADRFEIPADWKKEVEKPSTTSEEEFNCPKTGQ